MTTNSNKAQLSEFSSPLPIIPENVDKNTVKKLLTEYAIQNNFILTTTNSGPTWIHLKCKKGGEYKNRRNLKEEDRKRFKKSTKTGCPYYIRIGKSRTKGFHYVKSVSEDEHFHNHSLDKGDFLSTTVERKSNLTSKDLEKVNEGVERNVATKIIQTSISFNSEMNKLTVHDINNIKYSFKNKLDIQSENGATVLLKYIESKQFFTEYRCDPITNTLDGLFFTNETLITRTKRFPEVIIIDATYNTNNLRMPLICAYGVSNLGGMVLKTFPVAFCWVANEKEYMYCWFLENLKIFMGESLSKTIFVTDKCTALINQLDNQFSSNKKLLCTWHMINNLISNCNKKIFKDGSTIQKFKKTVFSMMNCQSNEEYNTLKTTIDEILVDQNCLINETQQLSFQRYYEREWETHVEKWAGHITSKLKHFGCTTTQRAESGHKILKKGMSTVQPLDVSFDCLDNNLADFERNYRDIEFKEKNEVDVLVYDEIRLKKLFGKISHRVLIAIRAELKRGIDLSACNCHNPIVYEIPCCHQLAHSNKQHIDLSDISPRWLLKLDSLEILQQSAPKVSPVKPWMEYIIALEMVFRTLDDADKETDGLMKCLDNILEVKNNPIDIDSIMNASINLPKMTDIHYPERPPKLPRLSSLKKDLGNSRYRKRILLYRKRVMSSIESKIKDEKHREESDEASIKLTNESDVSLSVNLVEGALYIPKKRKSHYTYTEKNSNSYQMEDLFKPQKKKRKDNIEKTPSFDVHPSINSANIKDVFDPMGGGYCGYRAISHLRYNDQHRFRDIKVAMLKALEKNKNIYKKKFGFNIDELKRNITTGIDQNVSQTAEWFVAPDCAHIVADTYDVPVCVYPDPSENPNMNPPLTYLPIRPPTKLKMKCKLYVIQNQSNIHWVAVHFGHLQTLFLSIQNFYFDVNPEYANLFQKIRNYYGQFPKIKSQQTTEKKSTTTIQLE